MNGTGGIIRITWHNCDEAGFKHGIRGFKVTFSSRNIWPSASSSLIALSQTNGIL